MPKMKEIRKIIQKISHEHESGAGGGGAGGGVRIGTKT